MTVKDLLRDISGATFNDTTIPQPEVKPTRANSSVAKSSTNTGMNKDPKAISQAGTSGITGKRQGSVRPSAVKPVNDVFTCKQNAAKFCMPLTLQSAREIEVVIQKEKEDKLELMRK